MATTVRADRITAVEFLRHPAARGFTELVHGEVRRMSPAGGPHSQIAVNVVIALHGHVHAAGAGRVFADGAGFALPHRDDTVRSPDAAFVRAGRLPDDLPEGWISVAPDLIVEVLSPSEAHSDVMEKLDDYFAGGTALAWVVDPRRLGVEVHTPDRAVRWVGLDGTLDGGDVLPGFRLPVAAVFKGAMPAR